MQVKIQEISLYQIYDSVGNATLEARINGRTASCPGGISTSKYEAKTLPTKQALSAFEKIKKDLLGSFNQSSFDARLEKLMPKLGSQATTALSMAFYNNSAAEQLNNLHHPHTQHTNNTFPNLLGNVLGGGMHAPAKTKLTIQEILVLPRTKTLPSAIETNFKIWSEVGRTLAQRGFCGLEHESAWTADINDETALTIVSKIAQANRAQLGVDIAATTFLKQDKYIWGDRTLSREAHINRILNLIKKYKLVYVEDPVHDDDFEGFAKIREATKGKTLICGDDLIATNLDRLKRAAREHAISAVLIKPNQIGTITASMSVINHAKKNKIIPIISHRAKETPDTTICTLAQHTQIAKMGIAGMRTVKLNGLLRSWYTAQKPKLAEISI